MQMAEKKIKRAIRVEDVLKQGDRKKDYNVKLWLTPQEVKEILKSE